MNGSHERAQTVHWHGLQTAEAVELLDTDPIARDAMLADRCNVAFARDAAFDRCGIRSVNDRRFREAAARASRGRIRRYFGTGGTPDLTYAYCSGAQS